MNREEIMKEFKAVHERINSVEQKLSNFTDILNADRKSETSSNESAIFELAEVIGGGTDGE